MIKDLQNIVGADNVFDDQKTLELYCRDQSLSVSRQPFAAVKPHRTEEVQELVGFANKTLTPLVPVSSKVHFWGSTIPAQGGIIVDLSEMNKILEIDPRNRRVKIEPGVTWHQLQEALKEHDQMPLNPLFPHPKVSALTSSLEGDCMLIPKYEYGDPVLSSQIVLGNGDLFKTGMASASMTQGVYPEGPGTNFFTLFHGAQGTLGIVTWQNIKTEYRPSRQKVFFVRFDSLAACADPIYRLQRRHIGNECFVLNSMLLAALLADDENEYEKMMAHLPPYTLVLVIAGAPRRPLERIAYEEEALMEVAAQLQFEPRQTVAGIAGLETTMIELLRNLPGDEPYWKTKFQPSAQEIHFITTMDRAQTYVDIAHGYAAGSGLSINEMGVYMQPLERGRACHVSISLPCDLGDENDVVGTRELYMQISEDLDRSGAFFNRPYGPWADMVYRQTTAYTAALKEVKNIFDPNNILNPGKLCY